VSGAVRATAGAVLCVSLLGAAGSDGESAQEVVIVVGALLALLAHGWALQRGIDRTLDERFLHYQRQCRPTLELSIRELRRDLSETRSALDVVEEIRRDLARLEERIKALQQSVSLMSRGHGYRR